MEFTPEPLHSWRPAGNCLFKMHPESRGGIVSRWEHLKGSSSPEGAAEHVRREIDLLGNWPELPVEDLEAVAAGRDLALDTLLDADAQETLREVSRITNMSAEEVLAQALTEHLRVLHPAHPLVEGRFFDAWGEIPTCAE